MQQHGGVLEAARLALGAVHDDGGPPLLGPGGADDGFELAGEREARSPAALQVYALGELHEIVRVVLRQRAVHQQVVGAIEPRQHVESCQQPGLADAPEGGVDDRGHCRPRIPSSGSPNRSVAGPAPIPLGMNTVSYASAPYAAP